MDSPSSNLSSTPVYKVGVVLRRESSRGTKVLVVRPHPKNPGELPKLVLPRGSRQYLDAGGQWHDVRDAATALAHASALEPLERTLQREALEEAGVDVSCLPIHEIGARMFASSSKSPYPIHWFIAQLDAAALAAMQKPVDASETRWVTVSDITALIAAGDFSAGYLSVIEEGIDLTRNHEG